MKTIKDIVSDQDVLLLLALASKVCGEKFPSTDPLVSRQIQKLRDDVAKRLTRIDTKYPGIIVEPSDGKPWLKRGGKTK